MRHLVSTVCCTVLLLASPAFGQGTPESREDPANQWNLEHLFPSVEAWNAERERLLAEFDKFAMYEGTLGDSSAALHAALRFYSDTYRQVLRTYVYSSLQSDEDLRDNAAMERNQLGEAMLARMREASAWMDPELIAVGEAKIRQFLDENPDLAPFRHNLEDTLRQAPHTLSDETERTLSLFSQSFDAPQTIYGILANSDIPYPVHSIDGEEARIDSMNWKPVRPGGKASYCVE